MSGNPALSPFLGWHEVHGSSMDRNSSSEVREVIAAHEFCKRQDGGTVVPGITNAVPRAVGLE